MPPASQTLALLGDSWVRGSGLPFAATGRAPTYFVPELARALRERFGDAGGGWCGLSYTTSSERRGGAAEPDRFSQTGTGSWRTHVRHQPTPDLCTSTSDTPGDLIRVTWRGDATSCVVLHAFAGGAINYRWNGGPWHGLTLGGMPGQSRYALLDFPVEGAWELDIAVAQGTVTLAGIEHRADAPGIRIHNLGAGGSSTADWLAAARSGAWFAGLHALAIDSAVLLLGTNDQRDLDAAQYRANLGEIVDRMRVQLPSLRLTLACSPENSDDAPQRRTRPMLAYQEAAAAVAARHGLAMVDLQPVFGDVADYGHHGTRPLLDASRLHPNAAGGAVLRERMMAACLALLTPPPDCVTRR
ncbi:SGNH/GDSL hydrolase family protein [Pandoraea sp. NPDC087047]|uniref:SGNH/GDSL hydrolase family protein n=1 Tax=Pandoraea sp. NPDC087047 TaxID=3364390 RepID=UPI003802D9B8